jgi:predicted permease
MSWWNRKQREQDLDRELAAHLDLESDEQREAGVSAGDARSAARRAFGNSTLWKESTRAAWGWTSVESIAKDLRFALRMLRKNPGFSAIAVLALALGIGVNTSVFTLVNAVLLRPLPFPHPEQLVRMWDSFGKSGNAGPISYPNFADWRAWSRSFSDIAAFTGYSAVLTGTGEAQHVQGMVASASLFHLLGVQPVMGRDFLPEEDRRGAFAGPNRIIISHRLWQDHFGRDASILGRSLVLDGRPYSVIGVMPAGFDTSTGIANPDFWVTTAVLAEPAPNAPRPVTEEREMSFLSAIARLKPGVSARQAQADMDRVASLLMKAYPQSDPDEGILMRDLQESGVGDQRTTLLLLLGAAGVVFLIACADVSGLVLARSTRRQREMTVRAALGAGRWRIVRQLLAESLLLSAIGGIAGLALATFAADVLTRWLDLGTVVQSLDPRVLAFAFVTAALAAIVFSMAPAIHASKADLIDGLKESALSTSESRRQKFWHGALVVGQIALAMMLLSSSAVLTLSLVRLQHVPLGFQPDHALAFPISLPVERYPQAQRAQFFQDFLGRVRNLPGVQSAGASRSIPLAGGMSRTVLDRVSGRDIEMNKRRGIAYASATPDYFRSMSIAVKRGREFTTGDTASSQPVVMINEAAAQQYFGTSDPVGQQIQPVMWNGSGSPTRPRTIVGVIANVKMQSVQSGTFPAIYWPITQIPSDITMFVTVRTSGDPLNLVNAVRTQLRSMDPDLPLYDVEPLDRIVSSSLARPRDTAALVSLFAILALTLTAVGLYGVIAYSVTRRTREIGVRIALGARPGDLLRSVVMRGLYLSLTGAAIGLPAAIASTRLFRSMLFEVSPQEPITLAAGAAVLVAVALVASYIPARRAARVDPMVALRYQ